MEALPAEPRQLRALKKGAAVLLLQLPLLLEASGAGSAGGSAAAGAAGASAAPALGNAVSCCSRLCSNSSCYTLGAGRWRRWDRSLLRPGEQRAPGGLGLARLKTTPSWRACLLIYIYMYIIPYLKSIYGIRLDLFFEWHAQGRPLAAATQLRCRACLPRSGAGPGQRSGAAQGSATCARTSITGQTSCSRHTATLPGLPLTKWAGPGQRSGAAEGSTTCAHDLSYTQIKPPSLALPILLYLRAGLRRGRGILPGLA